LLRCLPPGERGGRSGFTPSASPEVLSPPLALLAVLPPVLMRRARFERRAHRTPPPRAWSRPRWRRQTARHGSCVCSDIAQGRGAGSTRRRGRRGTGRVEEGVGEEGRRRTPIPAQSWGPIPVDPDIRRAGQRQASAPPRLTLSPLPSPLPFSSSSRSRSGASEEGTALGGCRHGPSSSASAFSPRGGVRHRPVQRREWCRTPRCTQGRGSFSR